MILPNEGSSAPAPADHPAPLALWKRALDITCCVGALPLLALSTALAGAIATTASPGPIFYRQERIGYRGRRFALYKLRTMHVSAAAPQRRAPRHASATPFAATPRAERGQEPAFIPGGRLFRTLRLAELPQIINVLRGDMTLFGPAPRLPENDDDLPAKESTKLDAVPGLTGLWSTSAQNPH